MTGGSVSRAGAATPIKFGDSPSIDAFDRLRVSNPTSLFDSKNIFDDNGLASNVENNPLFYDNAETSGSGTSTEYRADESSQRISVSATTAGTRIRQSLQSFNYQPGKSQLILVTFNFISRDSGVTKRAGYFCDQNGLFFEDDGTDLKLVVRSNSTGSVVDNAVSQSDWNIDKFDGTGPSGITLDTTKVQILLVDYEWLGVGRVRMGFVIDGIVYYAHYFNHANTITTVYMQNPNRPIRWEISNDGTGAASDLDSICASVISEGGADQLGIVRYAGSSSACNATTAGTVYAIMGIRLKSGYINQQVKLLNVALSETNSGKECQWFLKFNPSVAGTFTYSDETNSGIQTAFGDTANTVTGGINLAGGFFNSSNRGGASQTDLDTALSLGAKIDGTVDEIVLCGTGLPGSNSCDMFGGITWRELK